MAVRKFVKFAAPYSSKTFNKVSQIIGGVNGVVDGGDVSTSGPTVTVQPMTFVQNGLLVEIDAPLTATLSGSLTAPYFVAVGVSSGIENLSEVITPTFVKRPQDVGANTVLVAEWDGQEWRPLPKLQLEEIYRYEQLKAQEMDFEGVANGLDSTQDATTITVTKGTAIATDGSLVKKGQSVTLTKVGVDSDGLDRVDEVVLRKPLDSPARIAEIKYVVGPTFDPLTANVAYTQTTLSTGLATVTAPKILNSSATGNNHYFVYLSNGDLVLRTAPDSLSPVAPLVTLATTTITEFDAILNSAGSIDLVYIRGTNLHHKRVDTAGVQLIAESVVYTNLNVITRPKVVSVSSGATYYLHIAFLRQYSGSETRVMYARLSSVAAVETSAQSWVNLSDVLASPSLERDDDDSLLFLAFENTGTGRLYLRTFDASTPTASTPPTQIGNAVELQDDTYDLSGAAVLPSTGALQPTVKRTAFKETYVFWRHFKGGSDYGFACYHHSYKSRLGYKAVTRDLSAPGENIQDYAADVDGLNNVYVSARLSGTSKKAALRLADFSTYGSTGTPLTTVPTLGISLIFNSRGALIHGGASSGPVENFFRKTSAGVVHNLRDFSIPPSDIYLAHFRRGDGVLSVAGTAIEEDNTIRRLYEYNNLYASGGVATWSKAAANTLVLVSALVIRFFNRRATYTVPSNSPTGILIPANNVCVVQIPDDDVSQNVTLVVKPFGSGILDRHNRNTFPLFWNIGGNLYMRFAPWRADASGETIIVGEGVSQEMLDWLGASSVNPNPLLHTFPGTNTLLPTDSHELALFKLDQALQDLMDQSPVEESQIVGGGGVTTFTATTLAWFSANTVPDVTVWVNGMKQQQAQDGVLINGDFIKTSTTATQFSYTVPEFAKITARLERDYSGGMGGGGGGGSDLENLTVDISPDVHGNHALGKVARAFKSVFLKDKTSAQAYELEVVSGVFQVTLVP